MPDSVHYLSAQIILLRRPHFPSLLLSTMEDATITRSTTEQPYATVATEQPSATEQPIQMSDGEKVAKDDWPPYPISRARIEKRLIDEDPYCCAICNMLLNGREQVEDHLVGRKHAKNLKRAASRTNEA